MAPAAGLVVYALDPGRVAAFYEQVGALGTSETTDDHVVLESESFQLVVLRVPDDVAAGLVLDDPVVRREDTALKVALTVPELAAARVAAARTGGVLDPADREWQWQGWTVCDGHDPEGNVVQLREVRP